MDLLEIIKSWLDIIVESVNKKIDKTELPYLFRYCEVINLGNDLQLKAEGSSFNEYKKGICITFIPTEINTGSVTIDLDGLGVMPFRKSISEEFLPGEISISRPVSAIFNGSIFISVSSEVSGGDGSYIHPPSHPADIITETIDKQFSSQAEKDNWNSKAEGDHTHIEVLSRNAVTNTYEVGAAKMKFEENSLWSYMNLDSEGAILATNKSINLVLDSDNTHTNTHFRIWDGGVGSGHVFSVGENTTAPIFGPEYYKVFHDGYSPQADKWSTPVVMTFQGDVTGIASIDGSKGVTVNLTVSSDIGGASDWVDLTGKPVSSPGDIDAAVTEKHSHGSTMVDIDDAVSKKHSHTNGSVLDALSDNAGVLHYNGSPIEGGGGGHTIVDSADTPMAQRSKLKFVGATVADNAGSDETTVTVTGGGSIIETDTVFNVASLAELETLVASGNLGKPRAANTRDIIQWTASGVTVLDKAYDVPYDNVRFVSVNGGTFEVPLDFVDDYAFKFGVNCEFLADLTFPFSKVRYIRSELGGSSANTNSHWVDIQAYDVNSVNVALNKYVYDENNPSDNSSSTGTVNNDIKRVVDGDINSSNHYHGAVQVGGVSSLIVDLGSLIKIDRIKVWHYYNDGRTYYDKKLWISEDGVNWLNIYDETTDGTYAETPAGKEHFLTALDPRKDWIISASVVPMITSKPSFITYDQVTNSVRFLKPAVTEELDLGGAVVRFDETEKGIKFIFGGGQ